MRKQLAIVISGTMVGPEGYMHAIRVIGSLIVRDVTWIIIPVVWRAASRTNFPMLVFEELSAKFRDP
jgi:hypothetical protein